MEILSRGAGANMNEHTHISEILARLHGAYPTGFAIALHVKFTSPKYLFQSYDTEWIDTYSRLGLVIHDPTVRWGFDNTGTQRWSGLASDDPNNVLPRAAEHGLRYGFTVSQLTDGSRTVASFARGDREATDAEIAAAAADVAQLHALTLTLETLTPADHALLKQMSIYLTRG